jgi:hypothetical protein
MRSPGTDASPYGLLARMSTALKLELLQIGVPVILKCFPITIIYAVFAFQVYRQIITRHLSVGAFHLGRKSAPSVTAWFAGQ